MLNKHVFYVVLILFGLRAFTTNGFAQSSDLDAEPIPPRLQAQDRGTLILQAGIGSDVAFASQGVVEFGGMLGFNNSDNYQELRFAPEFGYFLTDNFEISTRVKIKHQSKENQQDSSVKKSNSVSGFIEPSIHQPYGTSNFFMIGLGFGATKQSNLTAEFAVSPRIGFKKLIGRSGLIGISIERILSLKRSEQKILQEEDGFLVEAKHKTSLDVGYTILL